jgi:hypothetical protein
MNHSTQITFSNSGWNKVYMYHVLTIIIEPGVNAFRKLKRIDLLQALTIDL